jgi:hypothetical protein
VAFAPAAATPTACGADEVTIFRCRTIGNRMIAVCASPGFSAQHGYLQYRYGTARRAEIVLPPKGTTPADGAVLGSLMFSRGFGALLRFTAESYRYEVYSAVSSYWGTKDGVGIWRGEEQLANNRCRGEADVQLRDEILKQAGIVYQDGPFRMPD